MKYIKTYENYDEKKYWILPVKGLDIAFKRIGVPDYLIKQNVDEIKEYLNFHKNEQFSKIFFEYFLIGVVGM